MKAEAFLELYERVAEATDAIVRLRRFVLDLAVRGKLVEQDSHDAPAVELHHRTNPKSRSASEKLPDNWRLASVGEVLDFRYGKALASSGRSDTGPVPVFGSNGVVGYTTVPLTSNPAVIVGRKGSAGALNLCHGPSWTTDVAYFVEAPEFFILGYLALALESLDLGRLGKGVKPGLNRSDAYAQTIAIPPVSEQRRIVAKVDELMALLDRLESARSVREATRDRFNTATLGRLTAADVDPESLRIHARFALDALPALTNRADQIEKFRQTILNLAVRGRLLTKERGEHHKVGDFRRLQNGYAFKSAWFTASGVRLLRNANVGHGSIDWRESVHISEDHAREFERFRLRQGDIVVSLDRPFIVTGTKVARVSEADLPSLLLQRVGRFESVAPGLDDGYLFLWINSPHFTEQIDPGRSNGVPHISSKQVEAAEILVPSLAEQERIVAKVDELMTLCDQLETALQAADRTRARLLESLLHEALAADTTERKAA